MLGVVDYQKVWSAGLQFPHQLVGGFTSPALSVLVLDSTGVAKPICLFQVRAGLRTLLG